MRVKYVLLISILMVMLAYPVYNQACSFEEKFEWVRQTFEENDAGVPHILEIRGQVAYDLHNQMILERIRKAETIEECAEILQDWLRFFRRGHHGIFVNQTSNVDEDIDATDSQPQSASHYFWDGDIDYFKEYISGKEEVSYEGIWDIGGVYTIGIIRESDAYIGFIIESIHEHWLPNMVKLRIDIDGENIVSTFYLLDFSPEVTGEPEFINNNFMRFGVRSVSRIYPEFEGREPLVELYYRSIGSWEPFMERINESTLYLRLPIFLFFGEAISQLIIDNYDVITSTENLIIDIRGNPGGSDGYWRPLLPFLYTNPIRFHAPEHLSSPLNIEIFYNLTKGISHDGSTIDDEDSLEWARVRYKRLKESEERFVTPTGDRFTTFELDNIYKYPQNVGIIIDGGVGSAAEFLALQAKQSNKVKLFGESTFGAIDTGAQFNVDSPCEEIRLNYSSFRFTSVPTVLFDDIGIQPDFIFDSSIPAYRWIEHVNEIMSHWVTEPTPEPRRRGLFRR